MSQYICKICGYEYEPDNGDPEHDVPAGTPFEQLPDGWLCPICGATKAEFEAQ